LVREISIGRGQGGFGEVHCSSYTRVLYGLFQTTPWAMQAFEFLNPTILVGKQAGQMKSTLVLVEGHDEAEASVRTWFP
jgi:hypothetical protein